MSGSRKEEKITEKKIADPKALNPSDPLYGRPIPDIKHSTKDKTKDSAPATSAPDKKEDVTPIKEEELDILGKTITDTIARLAATAAKADTDSKSNTKSAQLEKQKQECFITQNYSPTKKLEATLKASNVRGATEISQQIAELTQELFNADTSKDAIGKLKTALSDPEATADENRAYREWMKNMSAALKSVELRNDLQKHTSIWVNRNQSRSSKKENMISFNPLDNESSLPDGDYKDKFNTYHLEKGSVTFTFKTSIMAFGEAKAAEHKAQAIEAIKLVLDKRVIDKTELVGKPLSIEKVANYDALETFLKAGKDLGVTFTISSEVKKKVGEENIEKLAQTYGAQMADTPEPSGHRLKK